MTLAGNGRADEPITIGGPSLPVNGALADPTLELHDKDGVIIASNDDWRSNQEAEIMATGIPPTNNAESAIVATLNPDGYTAIVRGKNSTIGVALFEATSWITSWLQRSLFSTHQ